MNALQVGVDFDTEDESTATLRVHWPITDMTVSLRDVLADATSDLAGWLEVSEWEQAAPVDWSISRNGGRMNWCGTVVVVRVDDVVAADAHELEAIVDAVVVERLVAGAEWRPLNATMTERVAAFKRIEEIAHRNPDLLEVRGADAVRPIEGANAAGKRLGLCTTRARRAA